MKAQLKLSEHKKFLTAAKKQQIMDMTPDELDTMFDGLQNKDKDELLKFLMKTVVSLLREA